METALSPELERRHANVRAAMAAHDLDALDRLRERVLGLRGRGDVHVRLPDRPPLRVRRRARRRRGVRRLPDRGALRRRARDVRARAGLPRPARESSSPSRARDAGWRRIGVYGLDYVHDRARLPRARRPRPRPLRRRVRPRAGGEERRRARVRARLGSHQRARLRDLPRGVRAGEDGRRGDGRGRGVVRRRGLRAADDEHGAHGHRHVRASRVQDRPARGDARRTSCSRRSRSPGPGMHWVEVSRAIASRGRDALCRHRADARGVPRVLRGRARARCARARAATTSTAPSRPASPSAATTSATSRGTRSG